MATAGEPSSEPQLFVYTKENLCSILVGQGAAAMTVLDREKCMALFAATEPITPTHPRYQEALQKWRHLNTKPARRQNRTDASVEHLERELAKMAQAMALMASQMAERPKSADTPPVKKAKLAEPEIQYLESNRAKEVSTPLTTRQPIPVDLSAESSDESSRPKQPTIRQRTTLPRPLPVIPKKLPTSREFLSSSSDSEPEAEKSRKPAGTPTVSPPAKKDSESSESEVEHYPKDTPVAQKPAGSTAKSPADEVKKSAAAKAGTEARSELPSVASQETEIEGETPIKRSARRRANHLEQMERVRIFLENRPKPSKPIKPLVDPYIMGGLGTGELTRYYNNGKLVKFPHPGYTPLGKP
uniref:Uncharacterized protein n=1 Tax=Panagrolaimus sp. ES5 TaxID=591445 RepID=A0AC34F134_9BILA